MPPQYAYSARNRLGGAEKGFLEAMNPDEAVSILQTRDLVVLSVTERQAGTPGPTTLHGGRRLHGRIKPHDMVLFARSLAAMTEAGLPLLRGMELVSDQTASRQLRSVLVQMCHDVRGGSTFRDAVAKHAGVFSPFWLSLIETGEASGRLASSLEQIASHLEKSGSVRRKVTSALIYPAVLLFAAAVAISVFTLKVIPAFSSLFSSFGANLPLLTRVVIAFSDLMRRYFFLILTGMGGSLFLFARYVKTKPGRWQWDKLKLQLPIFGSLFQEVEAEQFASNLGTLLKAGVPILHALDILVDTCGNKVVASLLEHMRSGVREGRPLAEPMARSDIFPPMVVQMVAVGEQTGKLSSTLDEVAQYYQMQVATTVDRMTALLEPVMLIVMGLVIGTLVISMYLPVFQMSQIVKG